MPGERTPLAVGVDVGGTFTDIIVNDSKGLSVLKLPTTVDPSAGVLRGLRRLGPKVRRASLLSHATTLATNAIITRSGLARTALVTNAGFRDVLEIGRQRRPELYDLGTRRPLPLVERRDRLTAKCRMGADGSEIEALSDDVADALARQIGRAGFESVAICFLNSYLNGTHEERMRDVLVRGGFRGHISISSEVDREYREYERTSTTVVNAALSPLMAGYLSSLKRSLVRSRILAPVYVMNSDGGASTIAFASSRPVTVIESGPAAGVVASKRLAMELSLKRVLTFDMGGTTAKAGTVIGGEVDITNEFEAAGRTHSGKSIRGSGYPVRGQFIDLAEVSAGGGTIAWVDDAGELKTGPMSAGSVPGPACYGAGGTEPTVTDANVVLGRLNPNSLLGGSMPIHRDLALSSMRKLSRRLGLDRTEVAAGILRLVNNSMARALSMVTVERGRDPRDFVMLAFGGAGPVHACDLAEELGIDEFLVPIHAGLFSAYGLLTGELTRTFTMPVMASESRLEERFRRLEESAKKEMHLEGFRHFSLSRFFEGRYQGQSHELLLPFVTDSRVRGAFDARHVELYGYSLPDKVEVVNIRVRATVRRRTPGRLQSRGSLRAAPPSERKTWIGGEQMQAKVFTRESLKSGDGGRGPCIIEEYDSTLVVNPSWKWSAERFGTRVTR
ncbi:MAG TPA: hydantoinase/oxoprolinase family protein [Nitrososphaerales archaeon]|nr:hydantoinase/oxoprolinase family protein [Nitrososphaerales archaeon]